MRTLLCLLVLAAVAAAQPRSGTAATAARDPMRRGVTPPYGPRAGVGSLPAVTDPTIRVAPPTFKLTATTLGLADTQDVLFFAESRLVRFRLTLKTTGEPITVRWSKLLRTYFDFLDRDGSGTLNRHEAEFAFTVASVGQMMRSGFAYQRVSDAAKTFTAMDVDRDGRASFDEVAAFYAPAAARIVTAQANMNRDPYADPLTAAMILHLDADKNGRLSRAELERFEAVLATLDQDEDECLSPLEALPSLFGSGSTKAADPPSMAAFASDDVPASMTRTILNRYDRDKDGKLARTEAPFDDVRFATLDKDRDASLTAEELAGWSAFPPDAELSLALGDAKTPSVIAARRGRWGLPSSALREAGVGRASYTVGRQLVQMACESPVGVYGQANRVNPVPFPETGKGFATEKDVAGPQSQAIRVLFDLIDRDADGKMTRKEYDAFFNVQKAFMSLPLTLMYSAQVPSLFQVLDANGDGRLNVREVRTAWPRLIAMEPTRTDEVTRDALMPQGAIRFGRSTDVVAPNPRAMYERVVAMGSSGPKWFRTFDRNHDGDLSRREFPASAADFAKLDADADGFVTVEEAEKADKAMRKK